MHFKPTQADLSGTSVDVVWVYVVFKCKKHAHNGGEHRVHLGDFALGLSSSFNNKHINKHCSTSFLSTSYPLVSLKDNQLVNFMVLLKHVNCDHFIFQLN